MVADPSPPIHLLRFAIHKNCKTTCPKVENEISNIVHVQCILHLLKARTTMDNIFLSHSYILVFPPKSLFSITLILIYITLSLITLLRNHFFFHFIALYYKRNVILLAFFNIYLDRETRVNIHVQFHFFCGVLGFCGTCCAVLGRLDSPVTLSYLPLTLYWCCRHQQQMDDTISNLGVTTSDGDVNNMAAQHLEDSQASIKY